jgi:glycosyltransferase involved in cell wall biosynthesis
MTKKIFYVDRFTHYATQIFNDLQNKNSEKKNFEIFFIGPQKNDDKTWLSENTVKEEKRIWRYGHYVRDLFLFIKQEKPEIVHISFEWRMFGPRFATLKLPLFLFLLKYFTKTKILLSLHPATLSKKDSTWTINKEVIPPKIPRFVFESFVKWFIKNLCSNSDKILLDTNLQKTGLIEFYKINSKKIELTPLIFPQNNIEINIDKKKKFLTAFKNKKIILCFGVIAPRKSLHNIIKAFAKIYDKIDDYVLVISGMVTDDYKPYENMLHQLVRDLGLHDRVFFTGYVDDDESEILFDLADIALYIYYPTPDVAGSVFYAVYHNVPCIVTKNGYFDELFINNESLFVDYDDLNHLSDILFELCTNSV